MTTVCSGTVVGRDNSRVGAPLLVALDSALTCAQCQKGAGCGALELRGRQTPLVIPCRCESDLAAGTLVTVTLGAESGSGWLVPVVMAYGLPTLGLIGGGVFGALTRGMWFPAIHDATISTALFGAIGLAGGLIAGSWGMDIWRFNSRAGHCLDRAFNEAVAETYPVARDIPVSEQT